jgi:hypothetical protein
MAVASRQYYTSDARGVNLGQRKNKKRKHSTFFDSHVYFSISAEFFCVFVIF